MFQSNEVILNQKNQRNINEEVAWIPQAIPLLQNLYA